MAGEPGEKAIRAAAEAPGQAAPRSRLPAVLLLWARPRSAARQLAGLPMWQALCVHLLAGLATFVVITLSIDGMAGRSPGQTLGEVIDTLVQGEMFDPEVFVPVAMAVGFVELAHFGLAVLVMPWGAADEPLRRSFLHALRFTWLHGVHVAMVMLLGCALVVLVDRATKDYYHRQRPLPAPPDPPAADATAEQPQQHEEAVEEWHVEYQRASEERARHEPWLVRYGPWLATWSWIAGLLWLGWSLLQVVGTPRRVEPIVRPPTCEFCGYNLTTAPLDSRCPECGEAVVRSLGLEVRPGAPWERRRELGTGRAYRLTAAQAVVAPAVLGRSIRVATAPGDWRSFFPRHLPAVLILAWAAALVCYGLASGDNPLTAGEGRIMWGLGPVIGALSVAVVAGAQLLSAAVTGLGLSWVNRRNLLPASMQAAAYLGGYALAAAVFGSLLLAAFVFIEEHDMLGPLSEALRFDEGEALALAWCGLMFAWLCVGLYLTWRIASAARFANR